MKNSNNRPRLESKAMSTVARDKSHISTEPAVTAAAWFARLSESSIVPAEVDVPGNSSESLAALAAIVLNEGKTLLILVPDDEPLPAISNSLDLALRPLCLVLPSADFAARIALRATLSLLKSRLSRDGDDEQSKGWQRQRHRLKDCADLWQKAQEWTASNDRNPWPENVAELFPAKVLPIAAFRAMPSQIADFTVLYRCDAIPEAVLLPGKHLLVGKREATPINRALTLTDEATLLRIELAQITLDVGEMELELATAQAEMAEFTRRYFEQIGRRMTELDALQAGIADQIAKQSPHDAASRIEAERLQQQARKSEQEGQRFADAEKHADPVPPFRPNQGVKRLFRQLAQKIHPDRAQNESDRAWRTQLMSEANRAYRAGDADALQQVSALWDESGPLRQEVRLETPANSSGLLKQQIDRMKKRFDEIESELHRVFGSRLYELFLAARQAHRHGRDLLKEMADALDGKIELARAQL